MSLKLFAGLILALLMSSIALAAGANLTMAADMTIAKSPSFAKAKLDAEILSNATLTRPPISYPPNSTTYTRSLISPHIFVRINSSPSGAQILMDGNDNGFLTPHDYSFSLPENHTFELKLTGYKNYKLNVAADKPQEYNVALEKEELPKPLVLIGINSSPSGAQIMIDGNDTGFLAPHDYPFSLTENHTFELRLTGYKNYKFNVVTDKSKEYNVALEKEELPKPLVLIRINSNPSGARVWIDGKDTGENTPHEYSFNLQEGHIFELKLTGYKNYILDVVADKEKTYNTTLEKEEVPINPVHIRINSTPSGASIWMDGHDTGKITPNEFRFNGSENHAIELQLSGYQSKKMNISTSIDKEIDISMQAKEKEPKPNPIPNSDVFVISICILLIGSWLSRSKKKSI